MIKSAFCMVFLSCSTTSTLLPLFCKLLRVEISFRVSFSCKPMLGSSSTYITPLNPEPIWLAILMRCASPPLIVLASRPRLRYSKPTSFKKCNLSRISFKIGIAICFCVSLKYLKFASSSIKARHCLICILISSPMPLLATFTASELAFKRKPLQSGQGFCAV